MPADDAGPARRSARGPEAALGHRAGDGSTRTWRRSRALWDARSRDRLPRPAPRRRHAAAAPESVGRGLRPRPRLARLPRAGHDEQRLRRDARPARLRGDARRGAGARRSRSSARPTCPSPPTSRTASPTRPATWRGRSSWRARPGSPGARSRTPPAATTTRSTSSRSRRSASPRRSRRRATSCLTARAENHLWGRDDLGDTITRLQAYEAAGADVVYAPGLRRSRRSPRWWRRSACR